MKDGSIVDIILQPYDGLVENVKNEFSAKAVPLGHYKVSIRAHEEE
jgi:hypothetical protein